MRSHVHERVSVLFEWLADFIETLCGLLLRSIHFTLAAVRDLFISALAGTFRDQGKSSNAIANRASLGPCFNKTLKRSSNREKKNHHLNEFLVIHFSFIRRDRPRCARALLGTWFLLNEHEHAQ